jgi:succinyl-CoA synthetase alpha subunit
LTGRSEAELDLVVCITEGIPVLDMLKTFKMQGKDAAARSNCPSLITPDEIRSASCGAIHPVTALVSSRLRHIVDLRSGQLALGTGLGQSSAVSIGGRPINGLKHIDIMRMFQ